MAKTVQTERRQRGVIGWIVLLVFLGFNAFMFFATISGLGASSEASAELTTDAEKAGAAIGTVIGLGMIMSIWVMGAGILGLFVLLTRGRKVITTEVVE